MVIILLLQIHLGGKGGIFSNRRFLVKVVLDYFFAHLIALS